MWVFCFSQPVAKYFWCAKSRGTRENLAVPHLARGKSSAQARKEKAASKKKTPVPNPASEKGRASARPQMQAAETDRRMASLEGPRHEFDTLDFDQLREELKTILDETTYVNLAAADAGLQDSTKKITENIPNGIFVG